MIALLAFSYGRAQGQNDPLVAGFNTVPQQARLRMFWHIFGPAWEQSEIDYQLGLLQQAHVGGVMTGFTYPVAVDDVTLGIRNGEFESPEFFDTLRYAAGKAKADDIEFGVYGGTGWPFGGPTVSVQDSAQRIRMETLKLPPDGAGYKLPKLKEGERYLAAFRGQRDVTRLIRGDRLGVGEEPCRIFITGPTYMHVKRAALGGEGYVVDHLSHEATLHYLDKVVTPMLKSVPAGQLHTLFCDSLEVYGANWTHDFPAQFRRRRGYDLIPRLLDLFDPESPECKDVRFDFWRTVAELAEQEFAKTVYAYSKQHGVSFALEAYGTPPMGLTAAQYCDAPWGEQYEWKGFSFSRLAASGGHLTGKKIIGAEAWTWTGIPNRLADSLSDLKLCSDLHFLAGENELTGVDFPYSPRKVGSPGWMPYFGPVMNQNNPQWPYFHYLADYVGRCQWLLRQGKPVADVALYLPTEDIFAEGPTDQLLLDFRLRDRLASGALTTEFGLQKAFQHHSNIISNLLAAGYNFDGIDFFAMNQLAKVQDGELTAGDGRYHIVVLPNLTGIDLAAMEKIAQFCKSGGTVIATGHLPTRVYGRNEADATARLKQLVTEIFGPDAYAPPNADAPVLTHSYGKGVAVLAVDDNAAMRTALTQIASERLSNAPDMRVWMYTPDVSVESEIAFVHRRVGDRDFYFVVNPGNRSIQFGADFRAEGKAVTEWDPMTGAVTPHPIYERSGRDPRHFTSVFLELPPRGSTFLCFAPGKPAPPATSPPKLGAQPLSGDWHVTFDGPDAPAACDIHDLISWTRLPGAQFFSGRATYTCAFDMPTALPKRSLVRFEQIHEAGEVTVNGMTVGPVWMRPYELDITRYVHSGANTLQVTVGNLPVNRVLGLPIPDLHILKALYGDRFPAPQEQQLMQESAPSGLIGLALLLTEK